ncbi:cellulose biosynthesis protein BcsS [Hyphomicrobium sp.]|jgi:hypothetical protein|uniref:cellulose biosynthesis protein BcsS n=1 Tax=Hyphomicrobium sp. TaxID=82 RepID=UPI002B67530E|nr:cellulose biosynthesis protein BcsS [Hyphomicrobium sp.]HVZ06188.1 cellulose biosynthesis protein BcsS [Hyphomicrobium sp.]
MLQLFLANGAFAQVTDPSSDASPYGWRETWAGVDTARDQWLLYSGLTVAPASSDIYSDGWRLRVGGGYGQYSYDGRPPRAPCGDATKNDACTDKGRGSQQYTLDHSYAEILIGYYLRLGELTAKAFAGASLTHQEHLTKDPANHSDGTDYGFKGALELWLNITEQSWSSLDLSYATARHESSARWRTGWRAEPHLSIGPELRYDKNVETRNGDWDGRAGLFVRYDWTGGEVSVAGGVSTRVDDWGATDTSPYGTVNVLFQF